MRAVDEELEQRLSDIRKREKAARDRAKHVRKKQKVGHASTSSAPKTKSAANAVDESAFAPEDPPEVDAAGEEDGLKPHVRAMMNKCVQSLPEFSDLWKRRLISVLRFRGPLQAEAAAEPVARKVIYATRTHRRATLRMMPQTILLIKGFSVQSAITIHGRNTKDALLGAHPNDATSRARQPVHPRRAQKEVQIQRRAQRSLS